MNTPGSRLAIHPRALGRGVAAGLVVIIPISAVVEMLEARVDDFEGSRWLFLPFLGILFAYGAAGYGAARLAPDAPLTHGGLAGLGAFAGWLAIRVAVPLVRSDDLGFGPRAVLTNALFGAAFGLLGGALAARARDNGDGGESAGRPRHGDDRAEERPDSAGQGAG